MMKRILPFAVFLVVIALAALPLLHHKDPSKLTSQLLGQPAPAGVAFDGGDVAIVNFFASWCLPCAVEQPAVTALGKHYPVYGVAYKDKQADTKKWLKAHGNPYRKIVYDADGRLGINWGISGVPETFVIDKAGTVRYRHAGPISADDYKDKFLPLIQELSK